MPSAETTASEAPEPGARIIPESSSDTTQTRIVYVTVAVPVPLRQHFTYALPEGTACQPGCRVRVPFGPRKLTGIVTGIHKDLPASETVHSSKLRTIEEVLDISPLLPEREIQLMEWAARYYHHPAGEVIQHFIPALLRRGAAAARSEYRTWACTPEGLQATPGQKSYRQQELLNWMKERPLTSLSDIKNSPYTASQLKPLIRKGWVREYSAIPDLLPKTTAAEAPELTEEQSQALSQFRKESEGFRPMVLEGVTGSGKTEVYIRLIQDMLDKSRQVLMLIPEIGLSPQTLHRIQKRLKAPVTVMHSNLSGQERLDAWLDASSGRARIIISTRSGIFTPMPDLGLIIIDEEHDSSFKQQDGFRYHARDIAIKRAQQLDIPVLMGSATLSLETLHNCQQQKYLHCTLTQRAGAALLPEIHLIDLRKQNLDNGLSEQLCQAIGRHLLRGQQVLIFVPRRGYSPTLLCEDCGWVSECQHCDARMTLHRHPLEMRCHHCGARAAVPQFCPSCNSLKLQALGTGTSRAAERLQDLFPDFPAIRIDRDSTSGKDGLQDILQQISQGNPAILVGTQMIAKGHHFPGVTLVAVMDVDSALFADDFRAVEKTAQLLTQVAGRAGRSDKKGEVLIQTWHPQHPLFDSLTLGGYRTFARQHLLPQRLNAGLPPCRPMAMIRADSREAAAAEQFLSRIAGYIGSNLAVTGPFPATLSRRANQFRFWLILQHDQRSMLHCSIHDLCRIIDTEKWARGVSWGLDIDPQEVS